MPRSVLDESHIHPAVRARIATHHADIVQEVQAAVARNAVVVVGMGLNPMPKKSARRVGRGANFPYLPGIRQLSQPMAPPQCLENVDRLAHISHGVCQRYPGGRSQRSASPDCQR